MCGVSLKCVVLYVGMLDKNLHQEMKKTVNFSTQNTDTFWGFFLFCLFLINFLWLFRTGEMVYFRIYIFQMKCILKINRMIKPWRCAAFQFCVEFIPNNSCLFFLKLNICWFQIHLIIISYRPNEFCPSWILHTYKFWVFYGFTQEMK